MDREEDWDYDEGGYECGRCDGSGVMMVCCDDLCRNSGECVIGGGRVGPSCYARCFQCGGTGEIIPPARAATAKTGDV